MKVSEVLKRADRDGVWAFTPQTFSALCGGVERNYLKVMLKRLCDGGTLTRVAKGVYVNEDARCLPSDVRLAVVPLLRPREVSYVSLESRLSEAGVISQATTALTLMTTGAGHVFQTPFGVIDFTHTARPATPETAWSTALATRSRTPPSSGPTTTSSGSGGTWGWSTRTSWPRW